MRKGLFFILTLGILVAPVVLFAADLVPCGGANNPCKACHLVSLAQNVLQWLIKIMAFVIALTFAFGGFKMVMSAGNEGAVSSAKEMMTNSVIGFLLLLSGWLIVETVLANLVNKNIFKDGLWNQIQCVDVETVAVTPPPVEPGACSVSPLSPITDPLAQRMEAMNGKAVIWDAPNASTKQNLQRLQVCANKFTSKVGGSVTSAYRPESYQRHLYELKAKWCDSGGLKNNTDPACSTLKSAVSAEIQKHELVNCGAVAQSNSSHTGGVGVDISLPEGKIHGSAEVRKAAEESCLYWNNFNNDPYHYTLRAGCSCN